MIDENPPPSEISSSSIFIPGRFNGRDYPLIQSVNPGGGGESAGLRPGDLLLRYDSVDLSEERCGVSVLAGAITAASSSGCKTVSLSILRNGDCLELIVPAGPLGIHYHALPSPMERLIEAATGGNPESQFYLGLRYLDGDGVPADSVEAVSWIRKAAEGGNSNAQCKLGFCLACGNGVPADPVQAVEWFRTASAGGNALAEGMLGNCYERGLGVEKDVLKAVAHYQQSAKRGDAVAQYAYGYCLLYGLYVPENPELGVEWLRKSAENGIADAQYHLALCYGNGWGVCPSLVNAKRWFRRAAKNGSIPAIRYFKLRDVLYQRLYDQKHKNQFWKFSPRRQPRSWRHDSEE